MPLFSLLIPVEAALGIRPRNLQHRKRRPPVEPDGLSEEGPIPATINLPERDLIPVDNIRMALTVRQCLARSSLLSERVEHAVHDVNIEPEHGEFRSTVRVREADRVGESRTDLVFGNHHDVPTVLLHMLDDRQIHAVRFVPVAVVMAEEAAALERIISHVRRVRGERSRRATRAGTPLNRTTPSPSATAPQDLCQNPLLLDKANQLMVRACPGCPQTAATPAVVQSTLLGGHPRMSQLAHQRCESTVLKAGEDGMGYGCATKVLRRINTQPAQPFTSERTHCDCHAP